MIKFEFYNVKICVRFKFELILYVYCNVIGGLVENEFILCNV